MSIIMQDIYDIARIEGREEGREEGRDEVRNEMIVGMLEMKQPVELIAKIAKLPVERIIEIGKSNNLM